MAITPEALYLQLGRLIAEMPDLVGDGPVPDETNKWLGRAAALIEKSCDQPDIITFRISAQGLGGFSSERNVQTLKMIIFSALARAEMGAPVAAQGAFIPAGGVFDAFAAFGKVLGSAQGGVLIVDPYADDKALTDFAAQAPVGVSVRLLADEDSHKPTLQPAATRWSAQFGLERPLEVRLTPARTLHDRLVIIDSATVWAFGQSLNAIATRSHTSIVRADAETAALKIAAFEALWASATPI